MDPARHTPQKITLWGYLLAGLGAIVGSAAWAAVGSSEWTLNAREASIVGGPLVIAGAVLVAGGHIVDAIRDR